MFIIYEYAAGIVVALIAAAVPFTAFAVCLLLKNGAECVLRALPELTRGGGLAITRNLLSRTLGQSLAPVHVPLACRQERPESNPISRHYF
jgi:hypothetical protein